jgi:hypothetical protein
MIHWEGYDLDFQYHPDWSAANYTLLIRVNGEAPPLALPPQTLPAGLTDSPDLLLDIEFEKPFYLNLAWVEKENGVITERARARIVIWQSLYLIKQKFSPHRD